MNSSRKGTRVLVTFHKIKNGVDWVIMAPCDTQSAGLYISAKR